MRSGAEERSLARIAPRLYTLADGDTLGLDRVPEAAEAMARAGVRWVQLRRKSGSDAERWAAASESVRRLEGSGALVWIDDRADLAALLPSTAVHVGQNDLPPWAARRVVGGGRLIGRSCHDAEQVREADLDPDVDVIAIGPVFATASKRNPEPTVGLEGVSAARRLTGKPLVAIGGITAETAARARAAGADTVAVLSAAYGRAGEAGGGGIEASGGGIEASCRHLAAVLKEEEDP
ncbi:MAG: thiamine phosphate synthase [Acidobacteriota bacterium]